MTVSKRQSCPDRVSKARLKELANKVREELASSTRCADFDYLWYDVHRLGRLWSEHCEDPEGYDFHPELEALAEENGWSTKRAAELKAGAKPTPPELRAWGEARFDSDDVRTATIQELTLRGKTVGFALFEISGNMLIGVEFEVMGVFRTRQELEEYVRKKGIT